MSEKKFQPIASTALKEAWYDGTSKAQVVFKNGGVYEYDEITPEVWKGFEDTFQTDASSGKFFRANIQSAKFRKL